MMHRISDIPVENGTLQLVPSFYDVFQASSLLDQLTVETSWKHEPIVLFGKEVMQPRLTAWYGDSGTAYFIDNEEDLGGMVVEDLSMYPQYKLAIFTMTDCKNTNTNICGKLDYYENGYVSKTEMIKHNF